MKGVVFDIKSFAIHDGHGIRSTVFLKGCPLRCVWCHNPEGLSIRREVWRFDVKCIGCGECERVCPKKAVDLKADFWLDDSRCDQCGKCVDICPATAIRYNGWEMSTDEVLSRVLDDRVFYRRSDGGVTLSGGEPTAQAEFSQALLRSFHDNEMHTSIETSMFCDTKQWEAFFPLVDSFIVDIKCIDTAKHKEFTSVDNAVILRNFEMLAATKKDILVRTPLIKGMTATDENLRGIAKFVHGLRRDIPIELINYNNLALSKYRQLGRDYCFDEQIKPFTKEEMARFYSLLH